MRGFHQDLRHGIRMMLKNRTLSVAAILTLALGIGANTALFSAVNALLLRPLPVTDIDRLVFGMALRGEGFDPFGTSLLEFELYQKEARSLAASGLGTPRLFQLLEGDEPERVRGSAVTADYLPTLGVKPILGRLFTAEEDRPGSTAVALVGHELWQRRLGGKQDVVGKSLMVEGRSYTVVGVLPAGFDKPYSAELWVPMQVDYAAMPLAQRAATANEFVARLKPDVSLQEAEAELKGLARRLAADYPQIRRGWSFGIIPLRRQLLADLEGRTHRSLFALSAAVGFLLLLCCANVAGLLLARGAAREGEMAIRMSLGARRRRLIRQLLTESLLLAVLGGGSGILTAYWMQPLMTALNPIRAADLGARLTDFRIDERVLAFSVVLTLLTGCLAGLGPAIRASRSSGLMPLLKQREQRAGSGAGRLSLGAIAVGEIAVALTLLIGGGLMMQSFLRLQRMPLGFRPQHLLTLELPLSEQKNQETSRRIQLVDAVLERVRALPGVVAAGTTTNVPLQRGVTLDSVFEVEGRTPANPSEVPMTAHRLVSPGYMETLGVRLLKGRMLDESDRAESLPVAVVSRELARQSWPGEDAIGKRVRRIRSGERGPWMSVVGVVEDVKEDRFGFRIDRPVWYLPYSQQTFPLPVSIPLNLVARASGDPAALAGSVRRAVHAVDPSQPVASVMPMSEYLSDVFIVDRFSAAVMGALAGLGLLLAALGLYGVMAYSVSLRTGEIGLRMALGARPRDVLRLILGRGVALIGAGLVLGLGASLALTRLLAGMLYEVSATDPGTFAMVLLILAAIGLAACYLPARRASKVDPMNALRYE